MSTSRPPFSRNLCIRLSTFSALSVVLFYLIVQPASTPEPFSEPFHHGPEEETVTTGGSSKCSPKDWSAGSWRRKENPVAVVKPDDVYAASGFKGCACNREMSWHLSNGKPDEFGWRGNVSAYDWVPSPVCNDMRDDFQESLVVDLVERGGWLLIGDSITQEHFFSISCTLYPHVLSTPDYSKAWDRDTPQNLYLHPESPLVSRIKFPKGFVMAKTPLVTFRRNDLLFNLTEVESMFNAGSWKPAAGENSNSMGGGLFGSEKSWNISPIEYLDDLFFRPLPDANYHTLIVSTAGHWSPNLFAGLPNAYKDIYDLFRVIMTSFVYQAARQLDLHAQKTKRQREVVVRPYTPGDDKCHSPGIMYGAPLEEVPDILKASYNWAWIPHLNGVFKKAVEDRAHPHITYADVYAPGRLRPDAHVLSDCLHITVGAGVIEGWTKYLHYYLGTYLPWYRANTEMPDYPIP